MPGNNPEGSQETVLTDSPAYKVSDPKLRSRKCQNSQAKNENHQIGERNAIYAATMLEAWFAQEESDLINQT